MGGEATPRRSDRRLEAEWLAAVGASALLAGAGAAILAGVAGAAAAQHWLLVAGLVLAAELGYLGVLLARGDPGLAPKGTLGAANVVTLLRGVLYAAAGGFLFVAPASPAVRWAPALCYGAGAALDFVDGQVARRTGGPSELGERLDVAFDVTGMLVAPLVGVAWGRLPVWYLALSVAPFAFRAGQWWRRRAGRPVHPLPERPLRRRLAAFQMAFVAAALAPVVPASVVHPAATVALVPSLALFVRDWLAVSGRPFRHEE